MLSIFTENEPAGLQLGAAHHTTPLTHHKLMIFMCVVFLSYQNILNIFSLQICINALPYKAVTYK